MENLTAFARSAPEAQLRPASRPTSRRATGPPTLPADTPPRHWAATLVLMFFAGAVASFFNFLAIVHELWHVFGAFVSGARVYEVDWAGVSFAPATLVALAAGYYGEMLVWFALSTWLVLRNRVYFASFYLGAMVETLGLVLAGTSDLHSISRMFGERAALTTLVIFAAYALVLIFALGYLHIAAIRYLDRIQQTGRTRRFTDQASQAPVR